ncbi:hypothetical protein SAMN05660895_1809 [Thermoflavifilum thermophilum]|uniref:Uncharacterized protein n=1 Tax=Thermoflavifilum thermophilum TaxID=1393122 RepID=A0A1I7NGI6_9BACT|nr:hypothetical protein SAMN05660895_1809 [Thermoflavifilum thermophilum]
MDTLLDILRHFQPYAIAIVFLLGYLAEHVFPEKNFPTNGITIC